MREAEFREWLGRRLWKDEPLTKDGKNSRVQWCSRVERGLLGLRFEQTTLEAVFDAGQWAALLSCLAALKTGPYSDLDAVRSIVPKAENPKKQLGNMHAAVAQYGYFLEGRDPNYGSVGDQVGDDDMDDTDDKLLARFDGDADFKKARQEWTNEQRASFCKMARVINAVGLDWYHTNIPQIRFGRRSPEHKTALGTLGHVKLPKDGGFDFITFSNQRDKLGLGNQNYPFDQKHGDLFASAIDAAKDKIHNWLPPEPPRQGFWPNEITIAVDESPTKSEGAASLADPLPTNLILYGPPGTGKTYHTMREAVALCDGVVSSSKLVGDRSALMKRYRELEAEKRIAFVTFHQNYDYETFVEGLRPETAPNEGSSAGFRLEPRAGIFRDICALADLARTRTAPLASLTGDDFSERRFWKMGQGAVDTESDVYDSAIANNYITLGWGGSIDWSPARFSTLEAIKAEWLAQNPDDTASSNWTQTYRFRYEMKIGDIIIVPYGNTAFRAIAKVTGDYRFEPSAEGYYAHRRTVRWLLVLDEPLPLDTIVNGSFTMRTLYEVPARRVNMPALGRLIEGSNDGETAAAGNGLPDQFVLIIDEINRANISKVFGELITLIEPDKRLGMPNELTLTLPYSKKTGFGVPANLHIIGTMNTADRSIALLDTALRRRFDFKEMAPDPSLLGEVEGIDLKAVLTTINQRIEYLIDRDHRIGHAFFMGCKTRDDVDAVMRNKVIPLLQEYFFEDWSRIKAVLGSGFIKEGKLLPPPGIEGESRSSWSVLSPFEAEAFDRLLGKAAKIESGE